MSVEGGPRVPVKNLALYLDTTNPRSYPGSGTVWNDLAQGLTFNASGTTTPFVNKGGVNCFHFNDSGTWRCTTGYDQVDLGGDFTLEFWINAENNTERDTIFEKEGTTYNSFQQELAMTFESGEYINYYSRYSPSYDTASTYTCDIGDWNQIAIKVTTGKTATARSGYRSKNGSAWNANYTSNSDTALLAASNIVVGGGYAGVMENGYIAIVRVYHRLLSDEEILEMYNVTKERFGL